MMRHPVRVVALLPPEASRELSTTRWSPFEILFPTNVQAAVALLAAAPGGIVILAPLLSEEATKAILAAILTAGADIILYMDWHDSAAMWVLTIIEQLVPLGVVPPSDTDANLRLRSLLEGRRERSTLLLTLKQLAEAIRRLPATDRPMVVERFVEGTRAPADADHRGYPVAARTLERHLAAAGLSPPSEILRAAAVARARDMLGDPRITLAVAAERCGHRSTGWLTSAFKWATGLPPRKAVKSLDAAETSERLARVLRQPRAS